MRSPATPCGPRGCDTDAMAATDMTEAERLAFLADVHVGVLAIERDGKGPLAVPVWYELDGDDVVISMDADSAKAKLLARFGRATLTVQDERPPYRYVSVEGPVRTSEGYDVSGLAIRYLGPDLGRRYNTENAPDGPSFVARLTPERWLTCDYGKTGLT